MSQSVRQSIYENLRYNILYLLTDYSVGAMTVSMAISGMARFRVLNVFDPPSVHTFLSGLSYTEQTPYMAPTRNVIVRNILTLENTIRIATILSDLNIQVIYDARAIVVKLFQSNIKLILKYCFDNRLKIQATHGTYYVAGSQIVRDGDMFIKFVRCGKPKKSAVVAKLVIHGENMFFEPVDIDKHVPDLESVLATITKHSREIVAAQTMIDLATMRS
jgi:hypothetical protein